MPDQSESHSFNNYLIEDGVPLPRKMTGGGANKKYPLHILKPNQSFKVSEEEYESATRAASSYGKRGHGQFASRKIKRPDGTFEYRIFRIA